MRLFADHPVAPVVVVLVGRLGGERRFQHPHSFGSTLEAHAQVGAVDAGARRSLGRADQLVAHRGHRLVLPRVHAVDVHLHLVDRGEAGEVSPPLVDRLPPAVHRPAGLEGEHPHAVALARHTVVGQTQSRAAVALAVEALEGLEIARGERVGHGGEGVDDLLAGVEELPAGAVDPHHQQPATHQDHQSCHQQPGEPLDHARRPSVRGNALAIAHGNLQAGIRTRNRTPVANLGDFDRIERFLAIMIADRPPPVKPGTGPKKV